jgi:hypothetical protein
MVSLQERKRAWSLNFKHGEELLSVELGLESEVDKGNLFWLKILVV